ncbi:MAG: response regulator transcription factor [Oscillospiraceae bacterium]|nr:response regulator transcription factor [Oscillospiraceae bacterium]
MKILYVSEKDNISGINEAQKNSIEWCNEVSQAFEKAMNGIFSVAVIDESVVSSHMLCRYISEDTELPVLFICKDNSEESVLSAFEAGAADCMYGNNRLLEIYARAARLLKKKDKSDYIQYDDIVIHTDKGRVTKSGDEIYMSQLEYRILLALFTQPGQVVTRRSIADMIWESQASYVNENTVTVYISRIRKKIEDDPQQPAIVKTVRGIGYRLAIN